jgi:hypothetical protein
MKKYVVVIGSGPNDTSDPRCKMKAYSKEQTGHWTEAQPKAFEVIEETPRSVVCKGDYVLHRHCVRFITVDEAFELLGIKQGRHDVCEITKI